MNAEERKSILSMAMGAVEERVNFVIGQVLENIQDPNTRADKKRSLIVTVELLPDTERKNIQVVASVKPKLEATNSITSAFVIGSDENGNPVAAELTSVIPGQLAVDGSEQPEGIVIPLERKAL